MRRTLADNVKRLIDLKYPPATGSTKSHRQKTFSKDAGVAWSTVQRLLSAQRGTQVDVVTDIAIGLNCEARDLLTEGYGLRQSANQKSETGNSDPVVLHRVRGR